MNSLSVIICAYNEEKNVQIVMGQALKVMASITDDYELIVVNDGSKDKTLENAQLFSAGMNNVKVVSHTKNMGMGAALHTGYAKASKELVGFLPADGEVSPDFLKSLVEAMDGVDVVLSYTIQRDVSLFRKFLSAMVRLLVYSLFGYSPRVEGVYMFRREVFQNIKLHSTSFALNFEFVIKAYRKGYKFGEIGFVVQPRLSGNSKILNFKTIKKVFVELIKLRLNFNG